MRMSVKLCGGKILFCCSAAACQTAGKSVIMVKRACVLPHAAA